MFVIRIEPPLFVDSRVTYPDVTEQLVIEKVDARITGTPLAQQYAASLPEAWKAAGAWGPMTMATKLDSNLRGPFKVSSEEEPSDRALIDWYRRTKG